MLATRIIPCLDVQNGRVVKGTNFLNLRDAGDPVERAALYDAQGADELVFLDITASHERRDLMFDYARRVAEEVFIPFCVGGGIKTVEDFRRILKTGADKASINTAAVTNPQLITDCSKHFGAQCVVVAVDPKKDRPNAVGLGGVYSRRPDADRSGRFRLGARDGRPGRGRDHADLDGRRRHAGGL